MKRIALALVLLAAPAGAQDCFAPGNMQQCVEDFALAESTSAGSGLDLSGIGASLPHVNVVAFGNAVESGSTNLAAVRFGVEEQGSRGAEASGSEPGTETAGTTGSGTTGSGTVVTRTETETTVTETVIATASIPDTGDTGTAGIPDIGAPVTQAGGVFHYSGGASFATYCDQGNLHSAVTQSGFDMTVDVGSGTMTSFNIGDGVFRASNLALETRADGSYSHNGYFQDGQELNFDITDAGVRGTFREDDVAGSDNRVGSFQGTAVE